MVNDNIITKTMYHKVRGIIFNDLDEYAVKMTIVNMIMHGMRGVVAHMNTLTEEVIMCWQVTPYWNGGLGYVVPYGTDLRGAQRMIPRGKIIEAPTPKPAVNTIDSDKECHSTIGQKGPTKIGQKKGLDQWMS